MFKVLTKLSDEEKKKVTYFFNTGYAVDKRGNLLLTVFCIDVEHMNDVTPKRREIMEENREMIQKIWKKDKLNSEMIWKIWKKSKLNSEMIWTIWKKGKLNSEKI